MLRKSISIVVIITFAFSMVTPVTKSHAQSLLGLPEPGTMMSLSPAYQPAMIKGLTVHKDNPFKFDFLVDIGQDHLQGQVLKDESQKLIKYFLASLAIPEKDLWVNLSPYEKDRTVPEALGQTDMGRDLLAQDYILKQITASLIYPEKELGKSFWDKVYAKSQQMYGTTQIPVNTFNKVWILADKAEVFERNNTAFVVGSHLKVMLEEDYLATQKNGVIARSDLPAGQAGATKQSNTNEIVRQIILPEIEKEVNSGKNFANLRQIVNSLILASWYKTNLKQALLTQAYADKSKVKGIDAQDQTIKEKIYQRYLQAYKKGVFNYIKEDASTGSKETTPRKYFSGGFGVGFKSPAMVTNRIQVNAAINGSNNFAQVSTQVNPNTSPAMFSNDKLAEIRHNRLVKLDDSFVTPGIVIALAESGEKALSFPNDKLIKLINGALIKGTLLEDLYHHFGLSKYIIGDKIYQPSRISNVPSETVPGELITLRNNKKIVEINWKDSSGGLHRIFLAKDNFIDLILDLYQAKPALAQAFTKEVNYDLSSAAMTTSREIVAAAIQIANEFYPKPNGVQRKVIFEFLKGYTSWRFAENALVRGGTTKQKANDVISRARQISSRDRSNAAMTADEEEVPAGVDPKLYDAVTISGIMDQFADAKTYIEFLAAVRSKIGTFLQDGREFINLFDMGGVIPVDEKFETAIVAHLRVRNTASMAMNAEQINEYQKLLVARERDRESLKGNPSRLAVQMEYYRKKIETLQKEASNTGSIQRPAASAAMNADVTLPESAYGDLFRKLAQLKEILDGRKPSIQEEVSIGNLMTDLKAEQLRTGDPGLRISELITEAELLRDKSKAMKAVAEVIYDDAIKIKVQRKAQEEYEEKAGVATMYVFFLPHLSNWSGKVAIYRPESESPDKTAEIILQLLKDKELDIRKKPESILLSPKIVEALSVDHAMTKPEVKRQGGIDLKAAGANTSVRKEGAGVEFNIDPAMIARIKREGINSLVPEIMSITPVISIWPLLGLMPPKREDERLVGV